MTDPVNEREALQELVASEGWKFVVAKLRLEYQGAGYFQRMQTALEKGSKEARVLNETAKAVLAFITYPQMRINDLVQLERQNALASSR